jgi:hypothetical protein
MGGSILPVTIHNNKVYFLFGKERDIDENPGWSDFGGGSDKGETLMQTAVREGGEELTGFLGNIKALLTKYGTYPINYKSTGYQPYRCHIFPMKYDPSLPYYYNNNQRFLQTRLDPKIIKNTKIFEKTQIAWFSFADIKRRHSEFRTFYRKIIDLILKDRTSIESFVKKHLGQKNKRTHRRNKINKHKRTISRRF